jgi:hypothetical protein
MKFYTKSQVEEIYLQGWYDGKIGFKDRIDDAISYQTAIELPSDEEIKSYSDRYSIIHEDVSDKLGKYLVYAIHIDGAKWMKEQINNQNK